MTTLTIRNLNPTTKQRLRQLAALHGHSMEEEARRILDRAAGQVEGLGLGSRIAQQFADLGGAELDLPARSLPRPTPPLDDKP